MLRSQALQLQLSERRGRLAEIAAIEGRDLTEQERTDAHEAARAIPDLEAQYRAAVQVEGSPDGDNQAREATAIADNLSLRAYLEAARTGRPLEGREAEYNAERSLPAGSVPWAAIAPIEARADAVTGSPATGNSVTQHGILDRVFAQSVAGFLGVAMPSVGIGEQAYPVITAGTTAEVVAKDAAKESTAATIGVKTVNPARLQARYSFRREDLAITAGMEQALRRDLSNVMADNWDSLVLNGQAGPPAIGGFLATVANGGLAAATAATAQVAYGTVAAQWASFVEGKYATGLRDIRCLIGTETFASFASLFQANTADNALTYAQRETGGLRVSSKIAAKAGKKQTGLITRGQRGTEVVAPVWEGVTLIRDELSDAAKGWIHVTAVSLVGFLRIRDDSFAKVEFQLDA